MRPIKFDASECVMKKTLDVTKVSYLFTKYIPISNWKVPQNKSDLSLQSSCFEPLQDCAGPLHKWQPV